MKILLSITLPILFFALFGLFGQKAIATESPAPFVNTPPITFSASVDRTIPTKLLFNESSSPAPPGCYNLAVTPSPFVGGHTLIIDPGTMCPEDDRFFDDGAVVTLLAIPHTHYDFVEWQDDATGTNITTTVTMNEDKSVVGVFDTPLECHLLEGSISPHEVSGDIVPLTPYNCEENSHDGWLDGTLVQLEAVAGSGNQFIHWSGAGTGDSTENPYQHLFVGGDQFITSHFLGCHFLDKVIVPNGAAGSIMPVTSYNCEENFRDGWMSGTLVRLHAVPNSGYSFVHWSGDGTSDSTDNPYDHLFVGGDQEIAAHFVADTCHTVTVHPTPVAGGTYSYAPPENCADGNGWVDGTTITLTAHPNTGYIFNSWEGYGFDANPITMTMTISSPASIDIDLNFDKILDCYTLSVSPSPNTGGGASASPVQNCVGGWTDGTTVALYANPNPGYSFGSWDGLVTDTSITPTGVVMDADKSIIVNFDYTGNDLAIIKSGTALVQEGGTITYTLRVINNGSNLATSIIVNDVLPATVSYIGYSSSLGSCAPSGGNVVCFLGTLPAGPSSTEFEIYATANTAGTAVNTAIVYAAESDPNPDNNQDSTTTTIISDAIYLPLIITSQ